jgi:hypothetical protein
MAGVVALATGGAVSAQREGQSPPAGPAPTVQAVEIERGAVSFDATPDVPAPVPNHPPIHLIPPRAMPEERADAPRRAASGPGRGVLYDPRTRTTTEWPVDFHEATGTVVTGGGYVGADGGGDADWPADMNADMSVISVANRATHPFRMNV